MAQMNKKTHDKLYPQLVKHDGEQCNVCKRRPPEVDLDIDHIDGNNSNNDPKNLQLLCTPDNIGKDPRGKGKRKAVLGAEIINEPQITTAEFAKNKGAEWIFRHWLYDMIKKHGRYPLNEAINSGAEEVNCSPITIKRYLVKVCSLGGRYMIIEDSELGMKVIITRDPQSIGISADLLGS